MTILQASSRANANMNNAARGPLASPTTPCYHLIAAARRARVYVARVNTCRWLT
jgi:hypothetical protein